MSHDRYGTAQAWVDAALDDSSRPLSDGIFGGHILCEDGIRHFSTMRPQMSIPEAEMRAILAAVVWATEHVTRRTLLYVFCDSQSVVSSLTGITPAIRSLEALHEEIRDAMRVFHGRVILQWIPREHNTEADSFVRRALLRWRAARTEGVLA